MKLIVKQTINYNDYINKIGKWINETNNKFKIKVIK